MEETETRSSEREPRAGLQLLLMAETGSRRIDLPRGGTVTLGRGEGADIQIEDGSISRKHAALHVGNTLQLEDLGSSNGTFLHGARLDAGRRVDLAAGEFFEVGSVVCVVRGVDTHDRMRQVRTHEYFEARLSDEVAHARRRKGHPTVVRVRIGDLDHEDEACAALLDSVRAGDVVARYAPGEYEILVVDAESSAGAELVALLAKNLAAFAAAYGVAVFPQDGSSAEELFASACRGLDPDASDARDFVIESPTMRRLHELVTRVAAGGVNVLLLGETGVGKEVFAHRLHASSPRANAPFIKVNCAAFTGSLLESELFGHEKGAFTGAERRKLGLLEAAHGGMMFLDEIGELEAAAQAKLLRVIESRRMRRVGGVDEIDVDVVFVGATNRDLQADVAAGRFRADLFYRLDGFSLTIPPLRERREEVLPLARAFAAAAATRMKLPTTPALSGEAARALEAYRWPGNIRELRNMMDRAVLLSAGGTIQLDQLPVENLRTGSNLDDSLIREAGDAPAGLSDDERAERDRIIETLASVAGNQTRAAELLGISRRWLTTKMARYRIPRPRKRD